MKPYFESGGVTIYHGDCREILPQLTDRFDACITDPPYHLTTGKKGGTGEASVNLDSPYGRSRITTGFMGKAWDGGDVAFRPETWQAVLNALKPGAHLMAFGGTRTHHRLMCAIEDAGFEIRDCAMLFWLYGSGFPKSLDISKAIDKAAGVEREVIGRKTYAGNAGNDDYAQPMSWGDQASHKRDLTEPTTEDAKIWGGYGTALKPAYEPIIVGMKPLDGTFAGNALKHGVAGLNIDGSRIDGQVPAFDYFETGSKRGFEGGIKGGARTGDTRNGRWPSNVILDEETAAMLDEQTGDTSVTGARSSRSQSATVEGTNWLSDNHKSIEYPNESGGASRFFYTAKAGSGERSANMTGATNNHPTVKPLDLMRYLCRLVCPPRGGILVEPFMGSGSTVIAGRAFFDRVVACEIEEKYCEIAVARLSQEVLEFA